MEEQIHLRCEAAMKEFCRAIVEAKVFLQDCSADDFWKNANSITKLDTGEAYDVLLHNLIWSTAGFRLAILMFAEDVQSTNCKEIIEECTSQLSSYTIPALTQPRLKRDRADFYLFVESPQTLYPDESHKKRLTFLVQKSKAYQESEANFRSGGAGRAQQFDEFKIDPLDILDAGKDANPFLGAGCYAQVYRKSWLGQPVAVKVFRGVPEEVFKAEASLLAGLQNPFIIGMVGWCKQGEDCMLVMELAPTNLGKVMPLSRHAAVDIMLQISKGMEYPHKRGVIHRDINPNNVLLEPSCVKQIADEGHARVKLCDFGIAKVKQLSAEDRNLYTTLNQGTKYYRAPEVLSDDEAPHDSPSKYTRKADVFSFAIVCSEILAGKSATNCYEQVESKKELRHKMLANVRPNLPADCPSHLVDLIKSCWDTDPQCRPPFSRISYTLTYIMFILMRGSDVPRVLYDSLVSPSDEAQA